MKTTSPNDWPLWTPREGTASASDLMDGPRRSSVVRPQRRLITESSLHLTSHFGWAQWLELLDLIVAPASAKVEDDFGSDHTLWNALDSRAIGTNAPLEMHEIEVTIGDMRQGKPRAVAMEELDWEFLDFD